MEMTVNGYIDNNQVVVDRSINEWQGRKVIVTILDSLWSDQAAMTEDKTDNNKRRAAAMELAGLWKDHENELSVDETVRNMRRGRRFDI